MKKIFATSILSHDHNYFDGDYHYLAERHSRIKQNYGNSLSFFDNHFMVNREDSIVAFSCSSGGLDGVEDHIYSCIDKRHRMMILDHTPSHMWDHIYVHGMYYIDHHNAHAACAFLQSGFKEADTLAIDGGGVALRTAFYDRTGDLHDLTRSIPIGIIWQIASRVCNASEGKVMGMVAYGTPREDIIELIDMFIHSYDARKRVPKEERTNRVMNIADYKDMLCEQIIKTEADIFDIAASVQEWTNTAVLETLTEVQTADRLCISGGVAYNGYMNELLFKLYDEIYVTQMPGDEGQAVGTYLHANYVLNNRDVKLNAYMGKAYEVDDEWMREHGIQAQ